MCTFTQELDAVPPFSFKLTVHNPDWHWNNPLEIYEKGIIWTALHLSSEKPVGLRLESIGNVEKSKVIAKVFSRKRLTNKEENEVVELVEWGTGLKENIMEFYEAFKNDSVLKHAIRDLYGMRNGMALSTHIFQLSHTCHHLTKRTNEPNPSNA